MTLRVLPLETELFIFPPEDRNSSIIVRHYGFDGNGGANFQRIGDEVGLTRERVRQIVAETDPRSYLKPGGQAALEHAIAMVAAALPEPAAKIETRLQAEGITLGLFRLEGIIEAATLLKCTVPFRLARLNNRRFVVTAKYPRFEDIVSRARQRIRRYGMSTLTDCMPGAGKSQQPARELAVLEEVLSAQKDFKWLDRPSGWFWLSKVGMNRVLARIRKMFAVADTLSVSELRAALARMGDTPAPDEILLEFCRQMPELSVEGNVIRAHTKINVCEVLNPTERAIFELLAENNGCLSNAELIRRARALGMKRPSFYQCVTWSPIVWRQKRSHYRLIGSRYSGAAA